MRLDRNPTRLRAAAAVVAVAGSLAAAGLAPTAAGARVWDSSFLPVYTLSGAEKGRVCGNWGGTISYSDGFSVNCATGNVYYHEPAQS